MSNRRLRRLYALHSWLGVACGIALTLICASGAIAVFATELEVWSQLPVRPAETSSASAEVLYRAAGDSVPGGRVRVLVLRQAGISVNGALVTHPEGGLRVEFPDLSTGGDGVTGNRLARFLRTLHVRFFLGAEGRWLVGVLGLLMLVSLVGGVLIHRRLRRNLFTQRWHRSARLALSDLHKAWGVWALPFHLVIAATGAWLGLMFLLINLTALFGGPGPLETRASDTPEHENAAPLQDLDAVVRVAESTLPGMVATRVFLENPGRENARITVYGDRPGRLVERGASRVVLDGASGDVLTTNEPLDGWLNRLYYLMEPLHFGDFGGPGVKLLYLWLGLTPALLAVTGTLIWIDRDQRLAGRRPARNSALHRVHLALSGGGLAAMTALPALARWGWLDFSGGLHLLQLIDGEAASGFYRFVAIWLALAAVYATIPRAATAWACVLASAGLLTLAMPVSALVQGLPGGRAELGVGTVALALGSFLIGGAVAVRRRTGRGR